MGGRTVFGIPRSAVVYVPVILGLGFLSGRVAGSGPGNPWFDALNKPEIYPPPAVFGIVWSIIYVMIAIAFAMIMEAPESRHKPRAVALFVVQMVVNLAWTPTFFALHWISGALVLIVLLDGLVLLMMARFARIRRATIWLLLPYFAWISFATLLNFEFLRANPTVDSPVAASSAELHP